MMSARLLAAAGVAAAIGAAPASAETPGCNPPSGWERVADAAEGKLLWFGEVHGTAEGPAAVAEYLCAAASRGGRTVLAVEFPADDDANLAEGLGSPTPRETWLQSPHWTLLRTDGRHSEAMLGLLLTAKRLRDAGLDVTLKAIELSRAQWGSLGGGDVSAGRAELMAENVRAATSGFDRAILLTGNVHAMEASGDQPFEPAASRFDDGEIVSLAQTYDGGEAWVCQGANCGVYKGLSSKRPHPDMEARPALAIDSALEPLYDGYLHLGTVTASSPAAPAPE